MKEFSLYLINKNLEFFTALDIFPLDSSLLQSVSSYIYNSFKYENYYVHFIILVNWVHNNVFDYSCAISIKQSTLNIIYINTILYSIIIKL